MELLLVSGLRMIFLLANERSIPRIHGQRSSSILECTFVFLNYITQVIKFFEMQVTVNEQQDKPSKMKLSDADSRETD